MSYEMHHIGARGAFPFLSSFDQRKLTLSTAFNHEQSSETEAEYDRLRDLARQEANKRNQCFERVALSFLLYSLSEDKTK